MTTNNSDLVYLNIMVPGWMKRRLRESAEVRYSDMSTLARQILADYFRREDEFSQDPGPARTALSVPE